MRDTPAPPPPPGEFDRLNPIRPDATRVTGVTRRGKACELLDNTGAGLSIEALQEVLEALIAQDRFGMAMTSAAGGSTLDLARREVGHIQIGDDLFRLLLHRYTARLEPF